MVFSYFEVRSYNSVGNNDIKVNTVFLPRADVIAERIFAPAMRPSAILALSGNAKVAFKTEAISLLFIFFTPFSLICLCHIVLLDGEVVSHD